MSSDDSDSDAGGGEGEEVVNIQPPSKTKIFVSNLDGFFQKYLVKSLVESGTYEISGSTQDTTKKLAGVQTVFVKVLNSTLHSSLISPFT